MGVRRGKALDIPGVTASLNLPERLHWLNLVSVASVHLGQGRQELIVLESQRAGLFRFWQVEDLLKRVLAGAEKQSQTPALTPTVCFHNKIKLLENSCKAIFQQILEPG